MIVINFKGKPPTRTAQQKGIRVFKRNGKYVPGHYEKKEVTDDMELLVMELKRNVPPAPLEGPLRLTTLWRFAPPQTMLDSKKKLAEWEACESLPHFKRPDTGNLVKGVVDKLDRLNYFKDDGQIAVETHIKEYSKDPGVTITIERIDKDFNELA